MLVTLRAVPILRYITGGAAQLVAERLGRHMHDQLRANPATFSDGGSGFQRPLLVVADRSVDFTTMIQHAWSYSALCHDLLDLRLNRVSIPEAATDGAPPRSRTYDLYPGDVFWTEHLGAAFQTVASDVDRFAIKHGSRARARVRAYGGQCAVTTHCSRQLDCAICCSSPRVGRTRRAALRPPPSPPALPYTALLYVVRVEI